MESSQLCVNAGEIVDFGGCRILDRELSMQQSDLGSKRRTRRLSAMDVCVPRVLHLSQISALSKETSIWALVAGRM
eukprot:scaffold281387_cov20-Prasinocladus_malaysianus.AAC.1